MAYSLMKPMDSLSEGLPCAGTGLDPDTKERKGHKNLVSAALQELQVQRMTPDLLKESSFG